MFSNSDLIFCEKQNFCVYLQTVFRYLRRLVNQWCLLGRKNVGVNYIYQRKVSDGDAFIPKCWQPILSHN